VGCSPGWSRWLCAPRAALEVGPDFHLKSPQGALIPHAPVGMHLSPSGPPPPEASDETSPAQDPCVRGKGMLSLTVLQRASAPRKGAALLDDVLLIIWQKKECKCQPP